MTPFYGEPDPAEAVATIRRAVELGIDLLDTSDAYGNGRNEELISRVTAGHRCEYVIASKFGNLRRRDGTPTANGRPEYVRLACERSLRRLQTEAIDLYYIHRVDPAVPIEDTVGAMSALVREGKVHFLGISEASTGTIRRAHATHAMMAVQIEYSLWTRDVEGSVLDTCRELGIGFVAYSPLGRGFLTGTVTAREELRRLAEAERCTPAQLALAWVLSRRPWVVPIAGTSHRRWLDENAAASDIAISPATQQALEDIFRPGAAAGARYPDQISGTLGI
jgi:aryl-alcohol dehydrogenase-like predicted oxidoreductase